MLRAAEQYGVRDKFLDLFTFDVTQNPLRTGGWIDGIITDPPCKLLNVEFPRVSKLIMQMVSELVQEGWASGLQQNVLCEMSHVSWKTELSRTSE
jgi:tRNA G10  N-methylase Trm11